MTLATGAIPAERVRSSRPLRWLVTRVIGLVFVLWATATITFFSIRLIPGDPAQAVLGGPGSQASAEALAQVRITYGLDQPIIVQYVRQLGRWFTGDLGSSYSLHENVSTIIGEQLGNTLSLAVWSLIAAWLLALALATWSTRGGRAAWAMGSALEIVAAAVPHFWLGTVLILLFSSSLGWLPAVNVPGPLGLILPVATLAIPLAGFLGQVMRESLLDSLNSPYVLSARARGESEGGILWRHALRHAALPAISLSGWAFGSLVSGAVVVETVFARPGLGRSLLRAVQDRDVLLVSGIVLVVALAYCLVTVAADVLDRIADPRLKATA
ncbi:ABC transporter permease [Parafrigoribacterium mesophilum]|uniref:ABC transporter permease n=1 Tax=Parafrigoribacterium mesophilum TaxID=433646 RepID=UPI0031FC7B64